MLEDKLWFTFKARIRATERLQSNDAHSQIILIWYALSLAVLSIIAIRYPQFLGPDTDIISATLATTLLAISMLVTNRDFRGRAINMRRNYVSLQGLYNELTLGGSPKRKPQAIEADYLNLLKETENHLPIDYKYFRVFQRDSLISKHPTFVEYFHVVIYCVRRTVVLGILYLIPVLILIYFWPHT